MIVGIAIQTQETGSRYPLHVGKVYIFGIRLHYHHILDVTAEVFFGPAPRRTFGEAGTRAMARWLGGFEGSSSLHPSTIVSICVLYGTI